MVYSAHLDSEMMLRCMRAGAREFLTFPIAPNAIAEAIVRASARRSATRTGTKADGRLCVFCGVKGGAGVTTMATNFAVSAARESGTKVLLIDLDLPLGDTGLQLGITPQYSTVDALQNSGRLDANLLSRLVTRHGSGLDVLPAPGNFVPFDLTPDALTKLIQVARQDFDCIVVDAGSKFQLKGSALFGQEAIVYLVSHVGISELRNSNRIISELFPASLPKVEIILNRYSSSALGVDDEQITRALTRPAQWRIPEDRSTFREMQNSATPLAMGDSSVARVIRQMARAACGLNAEPEKKKGLFGLF
jgi:pilus assembly protein CpaE